MYNTKWNHIILPGRIGQLKKLDDTYLIFMCYDF